MTGKKKYDRIPKGTLDKKTNGRIVYGIVLGVYNSMGPRFVINNKLSLCNV